MNLPNLNHLVYEWLNLEKKKRIKKIKVKKCVGVTDEVLREKGKKKKKKEEEERELCGMFRSLEEVVGKKRVKNEIKKIVRVHVRRRKKDGKKKEIWHVCRGEKKKGEKKKEIKKKEMLS